MHGFQHVFANRCHIEIVLWRFDIKDEEIRVFVLFDPTHYPADGIAILFEAATRQIRDYLMDLAARKADITLSSALFRQALGLRLEHTPPSSGAFAHQVRQFETVRNFGTSASLAVVTDLPFAILFLFVFSR